MYRLLWLFFNHSFIFYIIRVIWSEACDSRFLDLLGAVNRFRLR